MSLDLNTATDTELNSLVAEHVAGVICYSEKRGNYTLAIIGDPNREPWTHSRSWTEADKAKYKRIGCLEAASLGFFGVGFKNYTTDVNAVLPLLEKTGLVPLHECAGESHYWRIMSPLNKEQGWVFIYCWDHHDGEIEEFSVSAPTFARAACLALVRAKRATP